MKNCWMKRVVAVSLAGALVLGSAVNVRAEENVVEDWTAAASNVVEEQNVESGYCGENANWELDSDGVMTIKGLGEVVESMEFLAGDEEGNLFRDRIKKIVIEDGITSIGAGAFACGFSNLTEVSIADSVITIKGRAFENCTSLKKVRLPKDVTFDLTEEYTLPFAGCSSLAEGTYGDALFWKLDQNGVLTITGEGKCFWQTWANPADIKKVVLDAKVDVIGKDVFKQCSNLTEISIAEGVTRIEDEAFAYSGLREITLPNGVVSIGERAFGSCAELKSLILPDSVIEVKGGAFENCASLAEIHLPSGVKNIGWGNNSGLPFAGCDSLKSGSYGENLTWKIDETGTLIITGKGERILGAWNTGGFSKVQIDAEVKEIGEYAFQGANFTESIALKGITSIGDKAFYFSRIEEIILLDELISIGNEAFSSADLTSITIPEGVKNIGERAFLSCFTLKDITILGMETEIGREAIGYRNDFSGSETSAAKMEESTLPTIHCYSGSKAHAYAVANEIPFDLISDEPDKNGLYNDDGVWHYYVNGKVDTSYVGLCQYGNSWYYIENGVYNGNYTGLCLHENGLYYVQNGVVNHKATGLCAYAGVWYYVQNGVVNFSATGLCQYGDNWYYVKDGKYYGSYTGLCQYGNGWYYVQNGVVNLRATGLCPYAGGWYYVQNGSVNFKATGLCQYGNGWYYVQNGAVNFKATGLCQYGNGWYYVQNGSVNFKATGLCQYGNGWYYVQGGAVNFKATGLCQYGKDWYYVENGSVNFSYTGKAPYGGRQYNVVRGKVVF